jgi:hypothetical protein
MPESFNFATEADDLLRRALEAFAAWAAENYRTTEAEARCLSEPTEAPAAYARGYNDALAAMPDALALWIEEYQ